MRLLSKRKVALLVFAASLVPISTNEAAGAGDDDSATTSFLGTETPRYRISVPED
ncbi:MAG: hypothetical protein QF925_06595 [Dehalococcoidia bacterium]|jgi:hypothetical protein|nr:hypothetical protein [Dehalococcoidia bacterium]